MRMIAIPMALLAAFPLAAMADDSWSGSGELGFAAASGNSQSENLNAKLMFKKEDENWKDNFYVTALRNKGEVKSTSIVDGQVVTLTDYELTSNRYEAGASMGYKLDERSYVVGALRYDNDDFSTYEYQAVASIGYGYTALKNQTDELSLEIGPGYKRYQPEDVYGPEIVDGEPLVHTFESEGEAVARGLLAYKHAFTANTAFVDTFLVEAGSNNTYLQNDAGLQVAISKAFALRIGYQVRYNSDVAPGSENTDQLLTTNLAYNFGGK